MGGTYGCPVISPCIMGDGAMTAASPLGIAHRGEFRGSRGTGLKISTGPLRPASYLWNRRIAFSAGVNGGWIERGCPDGSSAGAGVGTSRASANDEPANTKMIAASPKDFMTYNYDGGKLSASAAA